MAAWGWLAEFCGKRPSPRPLALTLPHNRAANFDIGKTGGMDFAVLTAEG
ncbi:MAG: hypothetical protein ACE5NM_10345 [Sedimentisphaerales bacterium]